MTMLEESLPLPFLVTILINFYFIHQYLLTNLYHRDRFFFIKFLLQSL